MIDAQRQCHGFGRIRPCLLWQGSGWWIGPLLADSPKLAQRLVRGLLQSHSGVVLLYGARGRRSTRWRRVSPKDQRPLRLAEEALEQAQLNLPTGVANMSTDGTRLGLARRKHW